MTLLTRNPLAFGNPGLRVFALIGVTAGLALFGTGSPSTAAPILPARTVLPKRQVSPPLPVRPASQLPVRSNGGFGNSGYGNTGVNGFGGGGFGSNAPTGSGGFGSSSFGSSGFGSNSGGFGGRGAATGAASVPPASSSGNAGNWRPKLQAVLQALTAADQAMRSSSAPNITGILANLQTALSELESLPPVFHGERKFAKDDIMQAIEAVKQTPPNPAAVGLTEDAIKNAQACGQI